MFLSDRRRYSDDERCEETGSGYQLAGNHFLHTASQGGLFAEAEPEAENKTLPEAEPEAENKTLPEAKPEAKNKTLPEAEPEAERKTLPEAEPEAENKTLSEAEPEVENKILPEAEPKAENKTLPEPESENKTLPEAGEMAFQTPISTGLEGRTVQQTEVRTVDVIVKFLKLSKKTLSKREALLQNFIRIYQINFRGIFFGTGHVPHLHLILEDLL